MVNFKNSNFTLMTVAQFGVATEKDPSPLLTHLGPLVLLDPDIYVFKKVSAQINVTKIYKIFSGRCSANQIRGKGKGWQWTGIGIQIK